MKWFYRDFSLCKQAPRSQKGIFFFLFSSLSTGFHNIMAKEKRDLDIALDERSLLPATLAHTLALGRRALHTHSPLRTPGCSLLWVICVPLFVNPWTIARQLPLSMEFSRQEYWSRLPFPIPGIFPTQGLNLIFYVSCIGRRVLPLAPPGKLLKRGDSFWYLAKLIQFCKV